MLKKVTLLIPVAFNDGTIVPAATWDAMRHEIYVAFKGWTIVGEVEGAYRMQQTGQQRIEKLLCVWVVVEEADIPHLKAMVARFGKRLGQEVMYFEVADGLVEFLPPSDEEEAPQ